jgi:hypothetical protein
MSVAAPLPEDPSFTIPAEAYEVFFRRHPAPMYVYDCESLRVLDVNDAALAQYHYDRDEFLALGAVDLRPPEEVSRFLGHLAHSPPARSRVGVWKHRRKDGSLLDAEVIAFETTRHGRRVRVVMALDDTERLRAEAALRISEERLAFVVQATTDVIWDWDLQNDTIWWGENFEKTFGFKLAELEPGPESWFRRIHPEDAQRVINGVRRCIEDNVQTWQDEYRFRRHDDTYAEVFDRAFVVRGGDGRPRRLVGGLADITERKRLQAQFLRMQRLESIGALAGGIAHDLNNMLAPIITSIEVLRLRAPDEQARQMLAIIDRSARHGAELVQQVLSFARGIEGRRAHVHMAALLHELARMIRDTFPKGVRVQEDTPPDLWPVLGSATQVHQVLLNLCVNARDAMPAGGTLTLSAENTHLDEQYVSMHPGIQPGRYVLVTVADTGCGIPEALRERIFEPFFTTKPEGEGTGLGLPTALSIIKDHLGHIHLYSELNKGSIFKVYLPAAPGALPDASTEHSVLPRGHGEWILIVDDEASILSITQQTLETFGYRVLKAANGADAIALYAQHRRDVALVMTDMLMPIMDGPATIHALMQINPRVKIIGASGLHANGHVAKAAGAGVRHFLPKPYTAATMLRLIDEVLRGEPEA